MMSLALFVLALIQGPQVLMQPVDASHWSIAYYNIDASNFVWSIQTRTNLADTNWSDEPIEMDGTDLVLHKNGRSPLFWRLKGASAQ